MIIGAFAQIMRKQDWSVEQRKNCCLNNNKQAKQPEISQLNIY